MTAVENDSHNLFLVLVNILGKKLLLTAYKILMLCIIVFYYYL